MPFQHHPQPPPKALPFIGDIEMLENILIALEKTFFYRIIFSSQVIVKKSSKSPI